MDASQVADVEGTVLTAALVAVVALVAVRAVARGRAEAWFEGIASIALPLAALVAVAATAGSLWFSEGAHFPPCDLCWYQRIAMYPLAVLLPVATWRDGGGVRLSAALLAGTGLLVSAWHVYVEASPDRELGGCDPTNPCTIRWVEGLGFWTIPRMALACFGLVLVLLALDRWARPGPEPIPEVPR